MTDNEDAVREVMALSGELGGNVTGAWVGFVVGGPVGAVAGAAIAPVLTKFLKTAAADVYEAIGGRRGKTRAAFSAAHAISKVAERFSAGEPLRDDGFFSELPTRSNAEQVLEGVMIKCRDAYEEKKGSFIGNIFVTASFDQSYSVDEINFLLRLAEQLTFQQYRLLKAYSVIGPCAVPARIVLSEAAFPDEKDSGKLAILSEIIDLIRLGLVTYKEATTFEQLPEIGPRNVIPGRARITELGQRLAVALDLDSLEDEEVKKISERLMPSSRSVALDSFMETIR